MNDDKKVVKISKYYDDVKFLDKFMREIEERYRFMMEDDNQ